MELGGQLPWSCLKRSAAEPWAHKRTTILLVVKLSFKKNIEFRRKDPSHVLSRGAQVNFTQKPTTSSAQPWPLPHHSSPCPLRSCPQAPHSRDDSTADWGDTTSSFQLHNVIPFISILTTAAEGMACLAYLICFLWMSGSRGTDGCRMGSRRVDVQRKEEKRGTEKRKEKEKREQEARGHQDLAPIRAPNTKVIDTPTCPLHVPITGLAPVQSCLLLCPVPVPGLPWFGTRCLLRNGDT